MKIAILKNEKIVIQEMDKPKLEQNGAIIKILGCGLCGSDIVKFLNKKNGIVLGHEIIGEIVEINSDTDFKIGDKIVMGHHVPCDNCLYCKGKSYSMCKQFKATNIIPGGFSEFIFVSELHLKNTVFKIPEEMEEIQASFMEPLGCCIRAIKRVDLPLNSKVLVIGLGSIGILMGQALKAYGHEVFGSDLNNDRLKLAKKLKFDEVLNPKELENYDVKEGFECVFLTAGSASTISIALKSVRDGGKILIFASVGTKVAGFTNNEIYYRELTVLGSYSPHPRDLKEALKLLKEKKVIVKNLSTIYNFEHISQAIEDTMSAKIMKAYIEI